MPSAKKTIGVIGVGNMGSAYATNLVEAGYDVVVFDIDEDRVSRMIERGARATESAAFAAAQADVTLSSLPSVDAIEAAYFGDRGIIDGAEAGTLVIEMSTTTPVVSEAVHDAAVEAGLAYADAPVIGLPFVAEAAELVIMVGGTASTFERAEPILGHLGKTVHHVGDAGDGHRFKLLNNMVLLTENAIAAEVFALADRMDVDRRKLYEIITSGMAGSETIEAQVEKALAGEFGGDRGARVSIIHKDLKLAQDMSYDAGFATPITAIVAEQYSLAKMVGRENEDYSVLMRVLEELEGR